MNTKEFFDSIYRSREALDVQILKGCHPSDDLIQKQNYSGLIEQSTQNHYKLKSEWYKGKRDGTTLLLTKQDDVLVKLSFQSGSLHGKCTLFDSNMVITVEYNMGAPTGNVLIKKGSRTLFEGTYQKGKPSGQCYCVNEKGQKYKGNMVLGVPKGYGQLLNQMDVPFYSGEWKNGTCNNYSFSFSRDLLFIQTQLPRGVPQERKIPLPSIPSCSTSFLEMALAESKYLYYEWLFSTGLKVASKASQYRQVYEKGEEAIRDRNNSVRVIQLIKKDIKQYYYNQKQVLQKIQPNRPQPVKERELHDTVREGLHEELFDDSSDDDARSVQSYVSIQVPNRRGHLKRHMDDQIIRSDDEDIALLEQLCGVCYISNKYE